MHILTKGSTNYFHLSLVIIGGLTVIALIYISYILTLVAIEENYSFQNLLIPRRVILSLESDKPDYNLGDIIKTSVLLNTTNSKTPGVGAVLAYDPAFLQLVTKSGQKAPTTKGIIKVKPETYLDTEGSGFDTFPFMNINYDESIISFAALKFPLKDFQGMGEIASLNFKTLKSGETKIKIVFEKGSVTDSNVAFAGKDILTSTFDLDVNIK